MDDEQTPGPHFVRDGADFHLPNQIVITDETASYVIAALDDDERGRANANLLAHACELLASMERAFDILEGIADKLLYEEGQPVTAIESREIEDIYNDAISELAPFETLIRKARGEA